MQLAGGRREPQPQCGERGGLCGAMSSTVAVIIPTYNSAHYLAAAIESALGQTSPPHEIIVVDDGSRDDPAAVTAAYPSVKLLRQTNQGVSAARNTGVAAATSDYLVFLDADDQLLPETLAKNLEQFAAHPDCGMVYGSYYYVDAQTRKITDYTFMPPGEDPFATLLRGNCIGMVAAVMFRRDVYQAVGGFDASQRASEDYDLYLRIARRYGVVGRPDVMTEYWQHGGNASRDNAFMLRWVLDVLRRYRDDAQARPEWRAAIRQGEANWVRFYADTWVANLRTGGVAQLGPLMKQALGITRIAPTALARSAVRAAKWEARLKVRRVRRALRDRSAQPPGRAS